ncbi:MAG: hypothetical protein ACREN3_15185 [Gemmatimonadaceae bacterium]
MLDEIDRLLELRADFAWESTLSGLGRVKCNQMMKRLGHHVEIIYLQLATRRLALRRIAARCASDWPGSTTSRYLCGAESALKPPNARSWDAV